MPAGKKRSAGSDRLERARSRNEKAKKWAEHNPEQALDAAAGDPVLAALRRLSPFWGLAEDDLAAWSAAEVRYAAERAAGGGAWMAAADAVEVLERRAWGLEPPSGGPSDETVIGYLARLARVSDGGESVLAYAYDQRPRDLEGRHVVVPGSGRGGGLPMNRVPAVVDLATLSPVEAIQVDGEPVSTATPDAVRKLRQWKRAPGQGDLVAGPKTLDGRACGDVVLQALAECDFRDLRSPLLGDIARVAALAVGLTGYGPIPDDVGAAFVGGADTPANRQRWWAATRNLQHLDITINQRTGEWIALANVDPDGRGGVYLGPPAWWAGRGEGNAWRLSGSLWRPPCIGGAPARGGGGQAGHYSGLARFVAGLEARLCYMPTPGRGRDGRVPDGLQPIHPGGPGVAVFVPWALAIRLSGEAVPADEDVLGTAGRRYRRRLDALVSAGYVVPPSVGGAAPAGDTVEIVSVQRGAKGRPTGLWIRASVRYCEAFIRARKREWERLPASHLLRGAS